LVDSTGAAVSIDDASKSGAAMTSEWQKLSKVAGTTFDTGRGLKISFESLGSDQNYVAGTRGAGAATVSYTESGSNVSIDVAAGDTLENIRDKINGASYLDAKAVEATIVDNRLILSTLNTGTDVALQNDVNIIGTNNILTSGLGFFDTTTTENGVTDRHLSVAQNAQLTINGLTISRSSNTITGVISGVTLNLADATEEGNSSTLTVKKDNAEVVNKVKSLLTAFNDVVKHLKLKTEPQLDASSDSKTPTYTAAPLGSDYSLKELRYGLAADLLKTYSGASNSAYDNLRDLSIGIADNNYTFELADANALTDALETDFGSVTALFDYTLDRMNIRLSRYLDDSDSIITSTQDGLDKQMKALQGRKKSAQELLTKMQEMYRQQYYQMQAQLLAMQAKYQNTMSMMYGSTNLLNQQY
jgi:flagellar hook-associated protein 2